MFKLIAQVSNVINSEIVDLIVGQADLLDLPVHGCHLEYALDELFAIVEVATLAKSDLPTQCHDSFLLHVVPREI